MGEKLKYNIIYIYYLITPYEWVFEVMGVPLKIINLIFGFAIQSSSYWGTPIDGTPHRLAKHRPESLNGW
jgi:hypothetical protein